VYPEEATVPYEKLAKNDIERHLLSTHRASRQQLKWWRWCVRNNCDGHIPSALQEYPCCPEKAFQSTGRPVFALPNVESWLAVAREEEKKAKRGDLVEQGVGNEVIVSFMENAEGNWVVYEPPTDGEVYAWAADTAVGLEADKDSAKSDPDASCGTLLNAKTRHKAAIYYGRPDIDIFADEMRKASHWYGKAWGTSRTTASGRGSSRLAG